MPTIRSFSWKIAANGVFPQSGKEIILDTGFAEPEKNKEFCIAKNVETLDILVALAEVKDTDKFVVNSAAAFLYNIS